MLANFKPKHINTEPMLAYITSKHIYTGPVLAYIKPKHINIVPMLMCLTIFVAKLYMGVLKQLKKVNAC